MRTWKTLALLAVAAALVLPASASAAFMHTVARGESLSSIAAADGLTVDQLAAANGISPDSSLIAGSSLAIPPQTGGPAGPGTTAPGTTAPGTTAAGSTAASTGSIGTSTYTDSAATPGAYVVQPGDTLSAIAARYGVSVDQLAAANGLNPTGLLLSGTTLSVSGAGASDDGGAESSVPAETQDVSAPVTTPASSGAATGVQPTSEMVTPAEVGSIAAANGVPASLAEAIGYQESGFNNDEVSRTGATGVMQIEPGTWSYIGRNLAGGALSPTSATDNVRGGVLLLHSLLEQTGGNPSLAAAAYYQGLPSVQRHGMYSDTQQYVNDVMALQQRFGGG